MSIPHDVAFALRMFAKDRWLTGVAVVTLALGIAVNTVVFTLVNAVLLRGLPFEDSDRIMAVGTTDTRNRNLGVSFHEFDQWRSAARTFRELSLVTGGPLNVSDEGRAAERYLGSFVSGNFFHMLGQTPTFGRVFTPDDDRPGAPAVAILGFGVWQTRYGGDRALLGRTVIVNEVPVTVIGVMPPGMKFPNTEVWLTVSQAPGAREANRHSRAFQGMGRLSESATIQQARDEFTAIGARLARESPDTNRDVSISVTRFADRINGPQITAVSIALMGAVLFVLLIACANIANLLLARAIERGPEISVRMALGASRARILRQLFVESAILAGVGGLLSIPLSMLGVRWIDAATSTVGKPYWIDFRIDFRVFTFFVVVCVMTSIVFGLLPALHTSRTDINLALRESGRSGTGKRVRRWTTGLVVGEVVMMLVLLSGAGFMTKSFLALYSVDLVIDPSRMVTMQLFLPEQKYGDSETRNAFIRRLDERLASNRAFGVVTTTSHFPFSGGAAVQLEIEGRPWPDGRPPLVTALSAGQHYFDALGLPVSRGRAFDERDGEAGRDVAIINQRLAAMFFKADDPLGRTIRVAESDGGRSPSGWVTIVGVVPNVRQRNPQDPDPDPVVYLPFRSNPSQGQALGLLVRHQSEHGTVTARLREEVRALDPNLPLFNVRTMDENLAQLRWPYRVFGTMFAILAAIALVLAGGGLYAITAYAVTQSTQEISIRLALGAAPMQVWSLFMRRACLRLATGLVIGLVAAVGVASALRAVLVQTGPGDLATLGSIATVALAVGLAACWIPTRRVVRVDAIRAVRCE